MPLDAICLKALTKELQEEITDGRIDKVQQPERDMLIISLRAKGKNHKLLVAAGTGNARVHLTSASFENPSEPPMFCMLMRKHLIGAHIVSLYQPELERLLVIELDTRDELGLLSRKKLIVEMIGRSSNIILVGEDGRIIDCMRRMDFAGDALRRLLPGMIYRFPPAQQKLRIDQADEAQIDDLIIKADHSKNLDKWILDSFSGLSPLICREIAYRCGDNYSVVKDALIEFKNFVDNGKFQPNMLVKDEKPFDFSFMELKQYGDSMQTEKYESFSAPLDLFYYRRDKAEQQRRRSHELMRSVKTARDRQARKLAGQMEELKRTENRDEVRKMADLVTANIYRMKKGDRKLVCQDYYQEDCPEISIALDPLKSPQQNAAALYKEYNKLKGAKQHLTALVEQGEAQLEYLNSVLEEIDRAETAKDISDIRRELIETGFIRLKKGFKPDKNKAQQPFSFISDDGFEILVGRSNIQNDELTHKLARRTDYWLHVQKIHGSHVIIRCDGLEPPERTIEQAASIAVYHSQARAGGKVPVDYTMVRFVRKPSGALPGKVLYTDYKTIISESDESLVLRLKNK